MHELNILSKPAATMSSREIAELVDSRHDSVKRTIDRCVESSVIAQPPLVDGMKAANGITEKLYLLDKRSSLIVVAQLCPEFTARIVDRWQELEAQSAAPATPAIALPQDYIQALESLLASKKSEQLAIEQRDQAIATKAQIGSKREATAMATASAAKKEAARLKDQLGFSARHATILQVECAAGGDFDFLPLRRWCKANEVTPQTVPDKRYPNGVKAWPAGAWLNCYGVDLVELFGEGAA